MGDPLRRTASNPPAGSHAEVELRPELPLGLVRPFPIMDVPVSPDRHDRLAAQVERLRAIGDRRRILRAGAYDTAVSTSRCSTTTRCGLPAGRARGDVPGAAAAVAASGDDARGVHGGTVEVPRVRAAAGRPATAAGGERAPFPQPAARAARPLAGGYGDARRVRAAGSRLGGARGARRHVAGAPRDLPGRVVRAARTTNPGGLTGPPAAMCCAAVPGTTTRRTSDPARATGTAPAIETTTTVFACRARPAAGAAAVMAVAGADGGVQGRS